MYVYMYICIYVSICPSIYLYLSIYSKGFALTWYRALTWYSSPARPFAAPDDPQLVTGQQGSPSPACQQLLRARTVCPGGSSEGSTKLKHGTKLGRTLAMYLYLSMCTLSKQVSSPLGIRRRGSVARRCSRGCQRRRRSRPAAAPTGCASCRA